MYWCFYMIKYFKEFGIGLVDGIDDGFIVGS